MGLCEPNVFIFSGEPWPMDAGMSGVQIGPGATAAPHNHSSTYCCRARNQTIKIDTQINYRLGGPLTRSGNRPQGTIAWGPGTTLLLAFSVVLHLMLLLLIDPQLYIPTTLNV
jgi:hypothetical protein